MGFLVKRIEYVHGCEYYELHVNEEYVEGLNKYLRESWLYTGEPLTVQDVQDIVDTDEGREKFEDIQCTYYNQPHWHSSVADIVYDVIVDDTYSDGPCDADFETDDYETYTETC